MPGPDNAQSMRMPGQPGGSPLMDYNNDPDAGQMKQRSLANVQTPALPGQLTGPFSVVSLPVEGDVRPVAGPAGSVPKSADRETPGVTLGPPIRSTPGGDVFPKGSGTVADPALPSSRPRVLPAAAIASFSGDRMPPVQGPVPSDAPSADGYSGRVAKPTPASGLQPGETPGLLPRAAE